MSAPERIWAASVTENYGEWQTTTDGLPRPIEYVRADLYAAQEAQLAEKEAAMRAVYDWMNQLPIPTAGCTSKMQLLYDSLSALEATPPAPKATECAFTEAEIDIIRHGDKLGPDLGSKVAAALTAAQEAEKP